MNVLRKKPAIFGRAEFLSPRDLMQRALVITALFLAAHLAGLREFCGVLNGTTGSTELNWKFSAFLGVIYVGLYLAFVLLVPILILAAALLRLGRPAAEKTPR